MAELPVRDLADVSLAELFAASASLDCPLCRRDRDLTARFLHSILEESVNDVRFREELDVGRGFCRRHVHQLLSANRATSGALSSAILFGAMLRVRRGELDAARAGRWSRSRRLSDALRPPDCPVCSRVAAGVAAAVGSLVRLSAEPAWASAIADAPFCLEHLVMLMRESGRPAAWDAIEERQAERLRHLGERLSRYVHHSSQDRRDQLSGDERASVDEAARLLGGSRSRS